MLICVVVGVTPSLSSFLPQQGVDEGALARVELAHHHQQEQLIELLDGLRQGGVVVLGGAEAHQHGAQVVQQAALGVQQAFLFGVEDMHGIGGNYSIPVCAGQSSLQASRRAMMMPASTSAPPATCARPSASPSSR